MPNGRQQQSDPISGKVLQGFADFFQEDIEKGVEFGLQELIKRFPEIAPIVKKLRRPIVGGASLAVGFIPKSRDKGVSGVLFNIFRHMLEIAPRELGRFADEFTGDVIRGVAAGAPEQRRASILRLLEPEFAAQRHEFFSWYWERDVIEAEVIQRHILGLADDQMIAFIMLSAPDRMRVIQTLVPQTPDLGIIGLQRAAEKLLERAEALDAEAESLFAVADVTRPTDLEAAHEIEQLGFDKQEEAFSVRGRAWALGSKIERIQEGQITLAQKLPLTSAWARRRFGLGVATAVVAPAGPRRNWLVRLWNW